MLCEPEISVIIKNLILQGKYKEAGHSAEPLAADIVVNVIKSILDDENSYKSYFHI